MPVRTKRLAVGQTGAAGAFTTVYTCPAGETCIVKHVLCVGANATAGRALVLLSSGVTGLSLVDQTFAVDQVVRVDAWAVLLPGDQIKVYSALAGGIRYWISGTELEGTAD